MSEENDYSLLTKDEQKKLHEKLFAVTRQVIGKLWQLRLILNLLIFVDQSESMSSAMFNLQINRADFFTHALNKDGWIPDKVNDEDDDNSITLEELLEIAGDDANIIALEELLEAFGIVIRS